jgi:hypothetical protein
MDADGHRQHQAHGDQLHRGQRDRTEIQHLRRVAAGRETQALLAGREAREAVQDDPEGDAGNQRAQHPAAARAQRLEADLIDDQRQHAAGQHARQQHQRERQSQMLGHEQRADGGPGRVGAVRRVQDAQRGEHQPEAHREQRVKRAEGRAVDELFDEKLHRRG